MSSPLFSPSVEPLTLVIAEDHELTRVGLTLSLRDQKGVQVLADVENGQKAVDFVLAHPPKLVLMDVMMPVMDGVTATRRIKTACPDIKIIMLTSVTEPREVYAALAAGADAYCNKDIKISRLMQVLEMVMEGVMWLDPAIAGLVARSIAPEETVAIVTPTRIPPAENLLARKDPTPSDMMELPSSQRGSVYDTRLTGRELEILRFIAANKTNQEIAESFQIAVEWVNGHVNAILQKLACDNRAQAAAKAIQDGLMGSTLN